MTVIEAIETFYHNIDTATSGQNPVKEIKLSRDAYLKLRWEASEMSTYTITRCGLTEDNISTVCGIKVVRE